MRSFNPGYVVIGRRCHRQCEKKGLTDMTIEERTGKIRFLIQCLKHEMPEYLKYKMPDDQREAFNLYRALCNVRMPHGETGHTLPGEFYTVQAEVLQDITAEKGVTDAFDAEKIPESRLDSRLAVWQGDITTLKIDGIVNAANSQMMGCFSPLHGCIDNIIHTMAGVELREKCYQIMKEQGEEEPAGQAKITPGYNLPAKNVLHTVGPIVQGRLTGRHRELLASCYTSCLELADINHLESVAFCCISTGVFMFPQDKAAEIAVKTVREWLDSHPDSSIRRVIFNVFKDTDLQIYDRLLNQKSRRQRRL